MIIAPVAKLLHTRDCKSAVRFWREVLEFQTGTPVQEGVAEVTSGPARITFIEHDSQPRPAGNPRPVIYLEVDNIDELHARVRERGGMPSDIEFVNGIKRRTFELRDPDENVVWIGQPRAEHQLQRSRETMTRAIPELPVDDVALAVDHYRAALGFSVNYAQHDLAVMDRDQVRVLLRQHHQIRGTGAAYFYVGDVDALYQEFVGNGASVDGEPVSQPWGLREFITFDLARNRLTFGQPFE